MTAQDAIQALADLPDLRAAGLSFVAIGTGSDGFEGRRINLTAEAQAGIADIAQDTRKSAQDGTLIAYGPAVLIPPQHWMYVRVEDAAVLNDIESVVTSHDLLPFTANDAQASMTKLLVARFTTSDQRSVSFYRVADSMTQLRRSKFLGLIQEGDVFSRLDPASVLLLRTDFDVVVMDGYAFFTKKLTFERAFGFLDQLKTESLRTFQTVTSNLAIEGMEALARACTSQSQMMAKMSSIRRNLEADSEYAAAMSMANLLKYIESHPHVDIDIIGTGADRRMVFDPRPARRFQILKLLDDDFLRSVLTEREYEASSKTQST